MNEKIIQNRLRATLLEMINTNGQDFMSNLESLIELLENKIDPTQTELYILENIYHVSEQMNLLKSNIEKYIQGKNIISSGNKLSELFDRRNSSF